MRGEHFAACPDYGVDEAKCAGCVTVEARDGAMVCDRCFRRMRRALDDAPDLVAHLRSLADPTKAMVYDRVLVSSSRPELPAPVAADLTDASESIMRTLREWAAAIVPGLRTGGLHAGALAGETLAEAQFCAGAILGAFDELANRVEVKDLGDALLTRHGAEPDWWSVADVWARWQLEDVRERWAQLPCPDCDVLTVWVRPPRRAGAPAWFACRSCSWERSDADEGGLWAELFLTPRELVDVEPVAFRHLCGPCVAGRHDQAEHADDCTCICRTPVWECAEETAGDIDPEAASTEGARR